MKNNRNQRRSNRRNNFQSRFKWRSFKNNNSVGVRRRDGETLDQLLERFEKEMSREGKSPKFPKDKRFNKKNEREN